jgi:hypothetical protein
MEHVLGRWGLQFTSAVLRHSALQETRSTLESLFQKEIGKFSMPYIGCFGVFCNQSHWWSTIFVDKLFELAKIHVPVIDTIK